MIRYFTELCKQKLEELSDEAIFQEATNNFSCYNKNCPRCGAINKLNPYDSYSRGLIFYEDGCVKSSSVIIYRFDCISCGATHALLPDLLIPYSQYTLRFKFTVLLAYFERKTSVAAICEHFCIAISTLYEWKKTLLNHKEILFGVLKSQKESALHFIQSLLGSNSFSEILYGFFRRHGFSFMQNQSIPATRTRSP